MILFCVTNRHFSTTLGGHNVQKLVTLQPIQKTSFKKLYMTILTVTQPYTVTWITLLNPYMMFKNPNKLAIVLSVTHRMSGHPCSAESFIPLCCTTSGWYIWLAGWLVHLAGTISVLPPFATSGPSQALANRLQSSQVKSTAQITSKRTSLLKWKATIGWIKFVH